MVLKWIPSHSKIVENEIADKAAKAGHSRVLVESSIITFDYVKGQINRNMLATWANQWQQCKSKGKYYEKFEMQPGKSSFYYLSNNCSKFDICHYYLNEIWTRLFSIISAPIERL